MNSYSKISPTPVRLPDGVRVVGSVLRAPVLGTLLLLEPIVRVVCGLGIILGLFACLAFKLSGVGPRFPLAEMLGISFGFGCVLVLYYWLIAFLTDTSRREDA